MTTGEFVVADDGERSWPPAQRSIPSRRRAVATLLLLGVAGVAADALVRVDGVGVAIPLAVLAVGGAVVAATATRRIQVVVLGLGAVAFASGSAVRASDWLAALDVVAALALLVLGAAFAAEGRVSDLSAEDLVRRLARGLGATVLAPDRFGRMAIAAAAPADRRWGALITARGAACVVLVVVPVLAVLAGLLALADPVFASWLSAVVGADSGGHVVLTVLGAVVASAVVVVALQAPVPRSPERESPVGAVEAIVALAGLVVVYGLFAASQGAALVGGDDYVQRQAGVTYAEYARSGFFELLAAAMITGGVLLVVRARCVVLARHAGSTAARGWMLTLGLAAVVLTLVSVVIAMRRLALYENAFGLTILRFVALAFAIWLAVALVAVAVSFVGVGSGRRWLVPIVGASALLWLAALNLINPAGFVMTHNLERAAAGAPFDVSYADRLSVDAVPALVAGLDRLPADERTRALDVVCDRPPGAGSWAAWNLARRRADTARSVVCR